MPASLSTERKLLCVLRFFATGSVQKSVGCEELIGMAQSAVSTTVHEVSEAIISVAARKQLVHFSLTPAAKQRAKATFSRRACIPGVLACVDGILVAIEKPQDLSLGDTESYMTRKGYYALNVMVVCDADLHILVIDPRFPGSYHDSWVWQRNPLREQLASQLESGEYVLGDSGYLLETWLLTPIPGNLAPGTPECEYNKEHNSTRNVVGRCIGVLKSRFRRLQRYRAFLYKPDQAVGIVSACAALHNIALEAGEPVFAEDSDGGAMLPAPSTGNACCLGPDGVELLQDFALLVHLLLRCSCHALKRCFYPMDLLKAKITFFAATTQLEDPASEKFDAHNYFLSDEYVIALVASSSDVKCGLQALQCSFGQTKVLLELLVSRQLKRGLDL
ncbi:hypothetical protein HPB50_002449 [Hyalomma asiaticum]|uniref:Uncharacterized protein n=1 Tax=Hyalomma asiaticum TaxID=266040 RepID=A0ACB7RXJ8_HYAAI|nr:hypothetical protein HPB50_002449 [Hyalomma asiaticum]